MIDHRLGTRYDEGHAIDAVIDAANLVLCMYQQESPWIFDTCRSDWLKKLAHLDRSIFMQNKQTILLVEDDLAIANVYMAYLAKEPYEVTHVRKGNDGAVEAAA